MTATRIQQHGLPCIHCMEAHSASLTWTKTGRPCLFCGACRSRSFLNSAAALRSVAVMLPVLHQILAKYEADPSYAEQHDKQHREYLAHITRMTAPASRTEHQVEELHAALEKTG